MKKRFERKKALTLVENAVHLLFLLLGLGGWVGVRWVGGAAPRRRTVCQLTHVCNVKTESRGVRRSEEEEMGGERAGGGCR